MSRQVIKYTIDELLSLFITSDPPEFLSDVSPIFVEESRTPIANYPKNVSKVTVSPKNSNLKTTKSEPIKNEQNSQSKVSDFMPKPISSSNENQNSAEFIPSFNPMYVDDSDKNKAADSPISQSIDNKIDSENPIIHDAPVFIPQDSPLYNQDLPYFIPPKSTSPAPHAPPTFIPQYPPGFYPPNYFDSQSGIPFISPYSQLPRFQAQSQPPDITQMQMVSSEQSSIPFLNNNIETSYESNSPDINKEQMDGFESVIEGAPDKPKNSSYWKPKQENTFNNNQPLLMTAPQFQPLQQQQFQPQYIQPQQFQQPEEFHQQFSQFQQPFEQPQKTQQPEEVHQVIQQSFQPNIEQNQDFPYQFEKKPQYQKPEEKQQRNNQFNYHYSSQSNKDYQTNNKQKKSEKKPKPSFSNDTVVEDVKNIKISPWGATKSKPSQQSFQDIMQSAKTNLLSSPTPAAPIVVSFPSSKSTKPPSKMTISTSSNKSDNYRNKKGNKYPPSFAPNEIPKPKDFTVDNIVISTPGESTVQPKSYVVYNNNFNSNSNTNSNLNYNSDFRSHMQIQNNDSNNSKLKITSQSIEKNKPAGFSPANIAIPPNFSNNIFPP